MARANLRGYDDHGAGLAWSSYRRHAPSGLAHWSTLAGLAGRESFRVGRDGGSRDREGGDTAADGGRVAEMSGDSPDTALASRQHADADAGRAPRARPALSRSTLSSSGVYDGNGTAGVADAGRRSVAALALARSSVGRALEISAAADFGIAESSIRCALPA